MSADYAAKERTFVAGLAEETGRDLAGWMIAIEECGSSERNAVIDWLRIQGFQFSRASWLERIHHNGGRLIYAADITVPPNQSAVETVAPAVRPGTTDAVTQPKSAATAPAPDAAIETHLATAKGLRPLAEALLAEIRAAGIGIDCSPDGPFIMISTGYRVAAMLATAKKIRLYADFGLHPGARVQPAEPAGKFPAPFPDMILLDDARSIDAEFRNLLRVALKLQISKTA